MKQKIIKNINLPINSGIDVLAVKISSMLKVKQNEFNFRILKKSIDARRKDDLKEVYTVSVNIKEGVKHKRVYEEVDVSVYSVIKSKKREEVAVIGAGPCGLFCALALAESGLIPVVFERGRKIEEREKDVDLFCSGGTLNTDSNIQFGEGGAGAFSDGKLNTGIKNVRSNYVFERFVECGAPDSILYDARPHIGTDRLKITVRGLREKIISLGGRFEFSAKVTDFEIENSMLHGIFYEQNGEKKAFNCSYAVLAVGHSAREMFTLLKDKTDMEQKAFSVGVRIEHLREDINKAQYGRDIGISADYKLSKILENKRGVYTFCMCPGGVVVPASSEEGGVVTNGMSNYARDAENSNSALLVSVNPEDFGSKDVLAGVEYQRTLEKLAYTAGGGNYFAPYQLVGDFLNGKKSTGYGKVKPSYQRGVKAADFNEILPSYVCDGLKDGICDFERRLRGFSNEESVLTGVETRSSSPVRILRAESGDALRIQGLYPAGEGAGYAGGITSAAVDGVMVAEKIIEKINS